MTSFVGDVVVSRKKRWDMSYSIYYYCLVFGQSWDRNPSKDPVVTMNKKPYPHSISLIDNRNVFKCDLSMDKNTLDS